MAFGKDRAKVNNMNLRQQLKQGTKRAPKGSGGGGGAYYHNKYQPPNNGTTDIIRVIRGEYKMPRVDFEAKDFVHDEEGKIVVDVYPYFKYISYFNAVKERSCIGSEGPLGEFKGKGEPCVGKDWYWYEWRERQRTGQPKPKSFRQSNQFAVTVLVQAPFYKVPQVDRQSGMPRINEATKEPYYEWMKGSKNGRDEYSAAGYERKDGHLQHWSMGYGHWTILSDYADGLAKHCRTCGGYDTIKEVALLCQGCGDAVVVMEETSLSEQDLLKVRTEEVQCRGCGFTGYLEDMVECQACPKGEQATLFDFDLEVKRIATGGDNSNQTTLQIVRAIGPKPIDQKYGDDLRRPLDLEKIFAPTPIAKQIELFGAVPVEVDGGSQQRTPSNAGHRA